MTWSTRPGLPGILMMLLLVGSPATGEVRNQPAPANPSTVSAVIRPGETVRAVMAAGDPSKTSVAFELQADSTAHLTIETHTLHFDTVLEVFLLEQDGSLTWAGEDDDDGVGWNSRLTIPVEAGLRYRVQVSAARMIPVLFNELYDDRGGPFELRVRLGQAASLALQAKRERDLEYWTTVEAEGRRTGQSVLEARALLGKTEWHLEGGSQQGALLQLQEALHRQISRREPDGEFVEQAFVLWTSLVAMGEITSEFSHLYESARKFPNQLSSTLRSLDTALYASAGILEIRQTYQELLTRQEREFGPEHVVVATNLDLLAKAFLVMGFYAEAKEHLERGSWILAQQEAPDEDELFRNLEGLGEVSQGMGSYKEARHYFEQAMGLSEEVYGKEDDRTAQISYRLALLLEEMGAYQEALGVHERVLAFWESDESPAGPVNSMGMQVEVGDLLRKMGDPVAAKERFERALVIAEELLDSAEEFVKAKNWLFRRIATRYIERTSESLTHLRELLRGERESGELQAPLKQTLSILARLYGDPDYVGRQLSILARIFQDLGWPREARLVYEQALKLLMEVYGPHHPLVAENREGLAATLWDLGEEKAALLQARRSAALLDRNLRETITLLPEQHALRLLSTRKRPESILFSGLVMAKGRETRWLSACWQWALRRSGLVLEELAQRHRYTLETDSPDAMAAWKHWRESRERLAALWVRGPDREHRDFYQATLQEASRDQQEAEVDLARVSARFREQIKTREITIKDVSNTLPRESALVQYVRVRIRAPGEEEGELHYIALVLAREKGNASFVDLGSASAIDHLVEEWRQSLWRTFTTRTSILPPPSNPVTQSGQRLREAIWDPVAAKIGRLRLIFIIPDGSLHQVTLAGLPAQQGGYLVEHQPAFHLLSTGRDLVRLRDEETHPPSAKGLLALGNPDYDADNQVRSKELENTESTGTYRGRTTACAAMLQQHWDRLPESGREVEAIGSFFQDGEPVLVLTDAAATEERFKQEAPGKRILHLATHGFFLQGPCLSAEDPGGAGPTTRPIGENPLLLSGLVLAGANSKRAAGSEGEDGILTAEELAALDLRGVEIVALSACDTGRGSVEAGEGVFGLRRALEIAGARTVLTSLWPVPDNEARDWMEAFYRSKLGGASVLESSRNASLRVLDALRQSGAPTHPYLWAGFVAAGGWE